MMRWNGWGMGSTWLFWLAILVAVAVFYLARRHGNRRKDQWRKFCGNASPGEKSAKNNTKIG